MYKYDAETFDSQIITLAQMDYRYGNSWYFIFNNKVIVSIFLIFVDNVIVVSYIGQRTIRLYF